MNDYHKLTIVFSPAASDNAAGEMFSTADAADILSAMLAEAGFESFEQEADHLVAYAPSGAYNREATEQILAGFPFNAMLKPTIAEDEEIEGEDWNAQWEKNFFQPYVFGGSRCVIHSSFHTGYPECSLDIVIDPKMAFGTGHHSTTRLMVEALLNNEPKQKRVLDVGTGSAILAILASKLGASEVTAVEIDPFACRNAEENVALNSCRNVEVLLGDLSVVNPELRPDVILSNITRNINIEYLPSYAKLLNKEGRIYLSGFYEEDVPLIEEAARQTGLTVVTTNVVDKWAMVCLK